MAKCIYCQRDSRSSVSQPHIFPQGVGKNPVVLPVGTECDRCNEYAGRRLEANVIRYPLIALGAQYLGTHGKKGKRRKILGGVRREPADPGAFKLSSKLRGLSITFTDGKELTIRGEVPPPADFDFLRFRRGLHHIAFNGVAHTHGAAFVLQQDFDKARDYIRSPRPATDSWPYLQLEPPMKQIPRVVGLRELKHPQGYLVAIQIFQVGFIVDLYNSGCLPALVTLQEVPTQYVAPDAPTPPPVVMTYGGRIAG